MFLVRTESVKIHVIFLLYGGYLSSVLVKKKAKTMDEQPHLGFVTLKASPLRIHQTRATKTETTLTHFVKHLILPTILPAQLPSLADYALF
jgi:hypothetical protein